MMPAHFRMIDANANRAREALRVMEDIARFALNDESISRELKQLRHDLRDALRMLPDGVLHANRDTPHDVGTSITTDAEMMRAGMGDLAAAAGKRLTEALRVIEETSKLLPTVPADRIEQLRYAAYELDQRLLAALATGRARQWAICVLLTESLCRRPWREVVQACVEAGADCLQIREKDMDGQELLNRTREIIALARPRGVSVIVNDRTDIAMAADADGVHLGTGDLPIAEARRIVGSTLLIGASTHDLTEARAAVNAGADYCGVGAMFPTVIKPDRKPAGAAYLRAFVEHFPQVPHLAIGGITPENVHALVDAGVQGIAVSGCVCDSPQPGEVVRGLREALSGAVKERVGTTPD